MQADRHHTTQTIHLLKKRMLDNITHLHRWRSGYALVAMGIVVTALVHYDQFFTSPYGLAALALAVSQVSYYHDKAATFKEALTDLTEIELSVLRYTDREVRLLGKYLDGVLNGYIHLCKYT